MQNALSRKGAKSHKDEKLPQTEFPPILGDLDLHLFGEGKHERIYEKLGAHVMTHDGKRGVTFAVWAPNANRVSVVGNFNSWDVTQAPDAALWELGRLGTLHSRVCSAGELYKYDINTARPANSSKPILTPP